jgi:hypothetical protein
LDFRYRGWRWELGRPAHLSVCWRWWDGDHNLDGWWINRGYSCCHFRFNHDLVRLIWDWFLYYRPELGFVRLAHGGIFRGGNVLWRWRFRSRNVFGDRWRNSL